jgi:hypothetical protein
MIDGINISVAAFFTSCAALLGFISIFYLRQKAAIFRYFGLGLLLNAVAFLFWLYIVVVHPANIVPIVGVGVVFYLLSFISFFVATLSDIKGKARLALSSLGILFLIAIVALRFIYAKSNPILSDNGMFWFNANQIVVYTYILAMSFSVIPAVYKVSKKIKNATLRAIVQIGFTQFVISTVVMLVSPDVYLQNINGWVMTITLDVIALAHIFLPLKSKK